jgi:alkylhydroperoxidase/carboxymuconolactone decarboxylase family protein YurZ
MKMADTQTWMNILENEDREFADLLRTFQSQIAEKKQNLETKHKYLIMAAVLVALNRWEQVQNYLDLAAGAGASTEEVLESLQPSYCSWRLWFL